MSGSRGGWKNKFQRRVSHKGDGVGIVKAIAMLHIAPTSTPTMQGEEGGKKGIWSSLFRNHTIHGSALSPILNAHWIVFVLRYSIPHFVLVERK